MKWNVCLHHDIDTKTHDYCQLGLTSQTKTVCNNTSSFVTGLQFSRVEQSCSIFNNLVNTFYEALILFNNGPYIVNLAPLTTNNTSIFLLLNENSTTVILTERSTTDFPLARPPLQIKHPFHVYCFCVVDIHHKFWFQ